MTMGVSRDQRDQQNHLISGFWAGFVSTALLFPLDLIKVRYQVHDGRGAAYKNLREGFKQIFRKEGIKGLYSGLSSAIVASSLSWAGYFYFYESSKKRKLYPHGPYGDNKKSELSTSDILLSGIESGVIMVAITNPIWLIKTRLQIQGGNPNMRQYTGLWNALFTIPKEEGILALYKGALPAVLLTLHGAIQFGVYEATKKYYRLNNGIGNNNDSNNSSISNIGGNSMANVNKQKEIQHHGPPIWLSSSMGGISKIIATICTYPFQVVKSRLQQQQNKVWVTGGYVINDSSSLKYFGVVDCFTKIIRNEGFLGLFKGLWANIFRTAPSSAITFLVYEEMLKNLRYMSLFEEIHL